MLSMILILLVAAIHFYFLYLEMFAWEAPRTQKVFGNSPELARDTVGMAANQGFYNGIVALGLLLGLFTGNAGMIVYLLCAVIAAGIYAFWWGIRPALMVQSGPALLALILMWIGL